MTRATYEVRQSFVYAYPGPIEDLRQVLIVFPPDQLGGQTLLDCQLRSEPRAQPRYDLDRFGNRICHITLPRVDGGLQFWLRMRIEQRPGVLVRAAASDLLDTYLLASPLAEPFAALRPVADELQRVATGPAALAEQINRWVYGWLTYRQGVTGVRTTARLAFELRQGVCQDYAHLMIALCRMCGLPARYVSGHLLGEGAMHAWVHVLLPNDGPVAAPSWQPFDPTHGRRAGMNYLTIATGRDYGDVSPTRGSFRAPYPGRLAGGSKQAGVLALQVA